MLPSTPNDVPSSKSPRTVSWCRLASVTTSRRRSSSAGTGPNSGRENAVEEDDVGIAHALEPRLEPRIAEGGTRGIDAHHEDVTRGAGDGVLPARHAGVERADGRDAVRRRSAC